MRHPPADKIVHEFPYLCVLSLSVRSSEDIYALVTQMPIALIGPEAS